MAKRRPQIMLWLFTGLVNRKTTRVVLHACLAVEVEETVAQIIAEEFVPIATARLVLVRRIAIRDFGDIGQTHCLECKRERGGTSRGESEKWIVIFDEIVAQTSGCLRCGIAKMKNILVASFVDNFV